MTKACLRTKQDIIDAIRQTAKDNGGKPLGAERFKKETGINTYDWGKYWARFGDAQKAAGFTPNKLQGAYADEFVIEKMISIIRKLNKFPTSLEIRAEKICDAELPNKNVFHRLGTKMQLASKVMKYCENRSDYSDVVELCKAVLEKSNEEKNVLDGNTNGLGEVYLFKSGRYYKIGKTNDTVRRGSEIRVQLPERVDLIHSIKTDDPSGIEAYWHRRFETKRMQGEWFDLNSTDVKAFKCWRRIV